MLSRIKKLGPGLLVSAAFIGPGTVTTSTIAGASYGYTLLWALLFATIATMILQEMSARLGTISGRGLGESLLLKLSDSIWKWPMLGLLFIALFVGNAAYEGGNLAGATLGIGAIFGESDGIRIAALITISLIAGYFLLAGSYQLIEKLLIILVGLMALCFLLTFVVVGPNLAELFSGLLVPSIPNSASLLTIIALIGTTVVPYNLFLHASAAKQRWHQGQDLSSARADTYISIGIGGLIAILITSTAAASLYSRGLSVTGAADMAQQLNPLFGSSAQILLGLGLFAAGLSSAITAPLATGFAVSELFGVAPDKQERYKKLISITVLIVGASLSLLSIKPIQLIVMAQFANGLLLPVVAIFLVYAANQTNIMGNHKNGILSNLLAAAVIIIAALLGARSIWAAMGAF